MNTPKEESDGFVGASGSNCRGRWNIALQGRGPDFTEIAHSMPSSENNKSCRVCGDKAVNVNFNVVTCESCKAFFRRNALKPKEFSCPFDGSCEITATSRKSCKKCRLRKCFEVGMMKEWIMTDEAKQQKRQLIESNRAKRQRLAEDYAASEITEQRTFKQDISDTSSTVSSSASFDDQQMDTSLGEYGLLAWSNASQNSLAVSSKEESSDSDFIMMPRSALLNLIRTCELNSQNGCGVCGPPPVLIRARRLYESADGGSSAMESPLECICSCMCGARRPNTGIGDGEVVDMVDTPLAPVDTNGLTDQTGTEHFNETDHTATVLANPHPSMEEPRATYAQTVKELLLSRRALDRTGMVTEMGYANAAHVQQRTNVVIDDVGDIVRLTQLYVNRIVEMHRSLPNFRSLSASDQVALLQGGISEQLVMQGVHNYSQELNGWLPFGRDQPFQVLADILNKLNPNLTLENVNFMRSFAPEWSSDEVLVQAMAAICLFDPNRRGVMDRQAVARHQQFYYQFMKQYVLLCYGHQEGSWIYGELLIRLNWLRGNVMRMAPTYHLELSSRDMRPLMFEMLL